MAWRNPFNFFSFLKKKGCGSVLQNAEPCREGVGFEGWQRRV
jgi:hypothetical protein